MNLTSLIAGVSLFAKTAWGVATFVVGTILAIAIFGYQAVSSTLSFLAATWVIQTFIAAWVAFQLQEIGLANSRKRDSLQAAYERKIEATKSLYALIERRIYASRRYLDVIESEPDRISDERNHYRDVVAEWNERVRLSQVSILLEFRGEVGLTLDNEYNPTFLEIDGLLRRQRLLAETGSKVSRERSSQIRKLLQSLTVSSLDQVREMLKRALRDRDIVNQTVPISEENIDHLSYGRLLKALVEPSM